MQDIQDIAAKFAEGRRTTALDKIIVDAYAEGYRNGYRAKHTNSNNKKRNHKDGFVDLGLPSGTLWSCDFLRDEHRNILFFTYEEACQYNIPTAKQWIEFIHICEIEIFDYFYIQDIRITGPNDYAIITSTYGRSNGYNIPSNDSFQIWLKQEDVNDKKNKRSGFIKLNEKNEVEKGTTPAFQKYKFPIMLVTT